MRRRRRRENPPVSTRRLSERFRVWRKLGRLWVDGMRGVESGVMVSLSEVISRVKNDMTILQLFDNNECDETALVSCLCQLDLGYMVLEDAGELVFWNCLRDPSESPEEVRAQLVRMLQCPSRVVLWPSRSVWVA